MKTGTKSEDSRTRCGACLATLLMLAAVASMSSSAPRALGGPLFQAAYIGLPDLRPADLVDVNGDGHLDIVSVAFPGAVTLGNGDGTFGTSIPFDTGFNGFSVAIGDLNGDGRLDLVTPDAGGEQPGSTVVVVLGNGDGTFAPKREWPTDVGPKAVAIADINRDGKLDVVTLNNGGPFSHSGRTLSILLGNGDGTCAPRADYVTGDDPGSLVVGDLNADGWPDIVTTSGRFGGMMGTISIFLGDGTGGFVPRVDVAMGSSPSPVRIADLNEDGRMDLVVAAAAGLSVLLGNGDGSFAQGTEYSGSSSGIAITDVNRDGHLDVATGGRILFGNGTGALGPIVPLPMAGVAGAGDLNEDGAVDLMVAGSAILLGNGDGTFGSKPPTYDLAAAMEPSASVSVCDLNQDGAVDLVVPNYDVPGSVSVVLGRGDGTFGPNREYAAVPGATSAAVGDLNGDGLQDVVVAGELEAPCILFGRGDGTLGSRAEPALNIEPNGDNHVAIGDVNADGRNDLVVATMGSNTLSILLGTGDGTFPRLLDYNVGAPPAFVAIADLNGDAKLDLVTANQGSYPNGFGTMSIFLGKGDGTFQARRDLGINLSWPQSIAIADLNHDGTPDLIVDGWYAVANIFLGDGSGGFEAHGHVPAEGIRNYLTNRQVIAVADLDGDGNADLAEATWGGFTVMRGNGDGTFRQRVFFGAGAYTMAVAIADLNRDGRPDLVGTGSALLNIGPTNPANVALRISPKALSLGSQQPWISATLTVLDRYLASDIAIPSLRVNGLEVPVVKDAGQIGHSGHELTVRLDCRRLRTLLGPGDPATVTLTGTIAGRPFTAADEIRIIENQRAATLVEAEPLAAPSFSLRPAFRLGGAVPTIRFSLASGVTATLELFNVQGRLLDRRDVTSGPGWHSVELKKLPAGVYLMRLRQAERTATSRLVVVH